MGSYASANPGSHLLHPLTSPAQPLRASTVNDGYRADIGSHAVPRPLQDHIPLQAFSVSAPIQHQETFGITKKYSQHMYRDNFTESGPMTAIPPTDTFSAADGRQRYSSAGPSQHNILTHRLHIHRSSQPSCNARNEAHPPVNTNEKQRDAGSILTEVDETFSEHVLAAIYRPPAIPDWGQLFQKWLQARRWWARDRGFNDPVLPELRLANVFDAWLQPRWPLLYNQGLSGPTEDPSRWIRLFDFWLLMPDTQELLSVQQPLSPTVQAPTNPTMIPAPIPIPIPSPPRPSTIRAIRRNTRNATSARTVVAIQQECEKRGGENEAIQRLEIVFPANTVVSRDALKVTRRSTRRSRSSTRNHQGYLEFAGRREGQHYCRLCGPVSKLWKNEKDLLNHVWNVHCDY